jgi:hypothetical protein
MKARGYYSWHIVRLVLGSVFVYAGLLKGLDPEAFAGQVAAYNLLPYQWNFIVAAFLPFVELIVGLHLIFNRWVRAAAVVVAGLCGTFLVLLASLLIRGMEIDCGCFGPHDTSTPLQAVARNLILLAMAHFIFHLRNHYAPASTDAPRSTD